MPLRIPEAVITEVRERTDIVQIVGQYVQLKRTGANFVGLCPFHEEKTPSFTVSPTRRTFYCFGCHEKGDIIDFVRTMEGKGFVDAVQELASRAGIDIPREEMSPGETRRLKRRRDEKEKALKVNEMAASFYGKMLRDTGGKLARTYLSSRGVSTELAERFRLGFAPDSWDALTRYLAKKRVPAPLAENLGLVKPRRQPNAAWQDRAPEKADNASRTSLSPRTHHDFFRNRLMFPVMGPSGEVRGFSGRLLDPEAKNRKYVNSPETPVFHKAESLYGIHAARGPIRRSGRALLVEGNLDVIKLHGAGWEEAVAPLGTALTDSQVHVLRRFSQKVVLFFDGDRAGREASRKAARTLITMDHEGWVATLPDEEDPDSYLDAQGREAIQQVLDAAKPAADFLIKDLVDEAGSEIPDKVKALEKIAEMLRGIPSKVAKSLYVDRAAEALDMDREMVLDAVRKGGRLQKTARAQARRRGPDGSDGAKSPRNLSAKERRAQSVKAKGQRYAVELIALLVSHPHLAPAAEEADALSFIEDSRIKAGLEKLLDMQKATGTVELSTLLEALDEKLADRVAKKVFSESFSEEIDAHRALHDILTGIKLSRIQIEWDELGEEMKQASQEGDEDLLREIALKRHELSSRRNELIGERV